MRCNCCNKMLSDFEATRRNSKTREFMDMCNKCIGHLPKEEFTFHTRADLQTETVDKYEEQEDYDY